MAIIYIIGRDCTRFAVVYSHSESKYPTIDILVGNSRVPYALGCMYHHGMQISSYNMSVNLNKFY